MSKQTTRLPHVIDPFRLTETRSHLEGVIQIKQFKRLAPLLKVDSGKADVVLDFDVDDFGVPQVEGTLKASLALVCQRCLERFDYPIDLSFKLAWVRSEQEAEKLPLQHEPYLVETTPLVLNDILEDEILLALPNIAMHELNQCEARQYLSNDPVPETVDERPNPFAVLAKLKDDKEF